MKGRECEKQFKVFKLPIEFDRTGDEFKNLKIHVFLSGIVICDREFTILYDKELHSCTTLGFYRAVTPYGRSF